MQSLTVFNTAVSTDSENRVSLNDLYRIAEQKSMAAGKMSPRDWARKDIGAGFIDHIQNATDSPVIKSKRGKGGGTFAHWQVALAYAKYLSHDLHEQVNNIYAGYVTASPEMAVDMVDRMGAKGAKWVAARADGRVQRLHFTDVLKRHGVLQGWQYGACTNAVYEPILGAKAPALKNQRGVPAKASLRDAMSLKEVMATGLAEAIAAEAIENKGSEGYDQCQTECSDAARRVKSIL